MATQLRDLHIDLMTRARVERGLETLHREFAGTFAAESVERYVVNSLQALENARLKDFVPLRPPLHFELAERRVHLVHGSPRTVNEYLFEDKPAWLYERLAAAEEVISD